MHFFPFVLKLTATDVAGPDLALLEAKTQADEQIQELQKNIEMYMLENRDLVTRIHDSEKRLVQFSESYKKLKSESTEKIQSADKRFTDLHRKFEDLKRSSAKDLSAMKMKHNEEISKLKTELDEARKSNAEFCEVAEPILDALNSATTGSNTSSFQMVIELLQSAPSKLKDIILESASVPCGQTLAVIKSLYPRIDLQPITSGYAVGTTAERALEHVNEVDDVAKVMAKDSLYLDEENNEE